MRMIIVVLACFGGAITCSEPIFAQEQKTYRIEDVLKEAEQSARKISDEKIKVERLAELAGLFWKSGNKPKSRELFDECFRTADAFEDWEKRDDSLHSLFYFQAYSGDLYRAVEIMENKLGKKKYDSILKSGLRKKFIEKALEKRDLKFAKEIIKRTNSGVAGKPGIAKIHAENGNLKEALKVAESVYDLALDGSAIRSHKNFAYNEIIDVLINKKKFKSAITITDKLEGDEGRSQIDSLIAILTAQQKAGKHLDAQNTLTLIERHAKILNDDDAESRYLISAYGELNKIEKALSIIKKSEKVWDYTLPELASKQTRLRGIKEAMIILDYVKKKGPEGDGIKESILYSIATTVAEIDGSDSALEILNKVKNIDRRDWGYYSFAFEEGKRGNFEKAYGFAEKIKKDYVKEDVLLEITTFHINSEDRSGAKNKLSLVLELYKKANRDDHLKDVGNAFFKIGDRKNALLAYRYALESVEKYEDQYHRSFDIRETLKAQTKVLGEKEALEYGLAIQSPSIRSFVFLGIAEGMLERKKIQPRRAGSRLP